MTGFIVESYCKRAISLKNTDKPQRSVDLISKFPPRGSLFHFKRRTGQSTKLHSNGKEATIESANLPKEIEVNLDECSNADSSSIGPICNGVLITPTPRRATISSPLALVDGMKQTNLTSSITSKFLPWRRHSDIKSIAKVRSPYLSKSALKKLSPTLRNSGNLDGSPWERLSTTTHFPSSKRSVSLPHTIDKLIFENDPAFTQIDRSSTSDSMTLPHIISPAYKFIPIGNRNENDMIFSIADCEIFEEDAMTTLNQPTATMSNHLSCTNYDEESTRDCKEMMPAISERDQCNTEPIRGLKDPSIKSEIDSTPPKPHPVMITKSHSVKDTSTNTDLTPFEQDLCSVRNHLKHKRSVGSTSPDCSPTLTFKRTSKPVVSYDSSTSSMVDSFESSCIDDSRCDEDDESNSTLQDWWPSVSRHLGAVLNCNTIL